MIHSNTFDALTDIAEIDILGVNLLKIAARVLVIAFGFVSSGQFVPKPLLFFVREIGCFERALEPFQCKVRHVLLHETVSQKICARARALATRVEHIVDRARVAIVARRTDHADNVRTIVLRVADAIAIAVTTICSNTLATPVQHVVDRARVAIDACRSDHTNDVRTIVLHVADAVAVAVLEGPSSVHGS